MNRKDQLAHARVAGFHGDVRTYVRLNGERRGVSFDALRAAYREGERARAAGKTPCGCSECYKPEARSRA